MQTYRKTNKQTEKNKGKDKHKNIKIRQTDKQTNRQTDKQTKNRINGYSDYLVTRLRDYLKMSGTRSTNYRINRLFDYWISGIV